ncbi:50S ribosomal protein L22 [Nitzschia inconspicua]|uniref:50S ribosomal protein L22 n=1 Tax=Nitzschia inconspicua TaxID=303405 RepID=A0A9K3KP73_9STRA|nr:50S ribosomal protein L22 [Nitzschia inconspicua]
MNVLSNRFLCHGSRFASKITGGRRFVSLTGGGATATTACGSIAPYGTGRSTSSLLVLLSSSSSFRPLTSILSMSNFSTVASTRPSSSSQQQQQQSVVLPTSPSTFSDDESGQQMGVFFDTRKLPKLKPSVVQRRLANCKTYEGREKNIRQSPWKLNRVCQLAAGLTLEEALTQLRFCPIKNADLVAKVLKRTSNLADIRDGIQMSQLEVAECFATKSVMLRRIKPMGRGRHGIMHHKFSHIRVVLREIDFPLKIYQQKSMNQKKKWLMHQKRAEQDGQAASAKRQEMERLMKKQQEQERERKAAAAGASKK